MPTTKTVLLMTLLLVATGCTSAHTYPTRGEELSYDATFSGVAVSIDPGLSPQRLQMFRQHRGTRLLRDAIVAQLGRQGRFDESAPYRLEIRVVGVHVKTWFEALFNGDSSSGQDYLTVDVVVIENDEPTLQTGASAASNRSAFLFLHERGRLANLSRSVAKVLTTQL